MNRLCYECNKKLSMDNFDLKKNKSYYTRCKKCRQKYNKRQRLKFYPKNKEFIPISQSHPHLVNEWDSEKNGSMEDYTKGSPAKVWWKCEKYSCHRWKTSICYRTREGKASGCPICAGRKVCDCLCNSLGKLYPSLLKEWDEEKNGDINNYTKGSNKKVWWKCEKKECHKWRAQINSRVRNQRGCPVCNNQQLCSCKCNSLAKTHPHIKPLWDKKRNGSMKNYFAGTAQILYFKCLKKDCHNYKARLYTITGHNNRCPICAGKKICSCGCNRLDIVCPHLVKEWDDVNDIKKYTSGSGKKIWWKCSKNKKHRWRTEIRVRSRGSNCPYCNQSKGEQKIADILNDLNIDFQAQYKLKKFNCDFFIPSLNVCIEYDGLQHFDSTMFYNQKKRFENVVQNDLKKNKILFKKNITVVRISYLCFENLKKIIKKVISKPKKCRFYVFSTIYINSNKIKCDLTNKAQKQIYNIYKAQIKNTFK